MPGLLKKYREMSVQAKSAIWFAMCSILQKGISFLTVPIFTRLLTPEQFGTYSLYLSWFQILTIFTSLYLYTGVFNNGMTKFEGDRDAYISSMQGLTLTITTVYFITFLAAQGFWSKLLGLESQFLLLMFAELAVTPALQFWSGRQRFENRYKILVAITLAKSIANPALGLLMVTASQDKAGARVASVVITELMFCGSVMLYQFIKGKHFFHKHYWKYALHLAFPLLPHYLSGMILNQGDRIMIDHMVGKSEVAFYSVAYSIGMLVQIVTAAMVNSFSPWMYQRLKAGKYNGIKDTINKLLLITVVFTTSLSLCGPELVLIFGSKDYAGAVYVIPAVASSVFFIFLYNLLAIPQFYFEKTKYLMISSIAAAAVNIILNYVFIRIYGYIAAGFTTLACYILYSLGHYIVSRRVLQDYLGGQELYDGMGIICLAGAAVFTGIVSNLLVEYLVARYAFILVIMIAAYTMRGRLYAFWGRMKER